MYIGQMEVKDFLFLSHWYITLCPYSYLNSIFLCVLHDSERECIFLRLTVFKVQQEDTALSSFGNEEWPKEFWMKFPVTTFR